MAGIGWIVIILCGIAWTLLLWQLFAYGLGLALGGNGAPVEAVDAMRAWGIALTVVSALVCVLAAIARRWVLLPVAVVFVLVGIVFLSGEITTA
jgi:hypothetical protein